MPGVLLLASAAMAVYSGYQAKQTADYNAEVLEQESKYAQDKAAYDEELHRERVRKLLSSQRAAYGKSGVDSTGSPLLTMEDTVKKSELDALAIRHGGSMEASRLKSQAAMSKEEGKQARTQGYVKAGQTLLSGANSYYSGGYGGQG